MVGRIAFVLALLIIGSTRAENYFSFTDSERSPFGEIIRWWAGDTLWGSIRSNGPIHMLSCPAIYDDAQIITGAPHDSFGHPCDPYVVYNAPLIELPTSATRVREWATDQWNFIDADENTRARVVIEDHALRITWGMEGIPFDTTFYEYYPLFDSSVVFFDCPLQLSGIVHDILIIGSSHDIGLENDIRYSCASNFGHEIPEDCPDKLAIVSEKSIYILNTPANGRNNSDGMGNNQPDQNLTSIVVTGFLAALGLDDGVFSFDQQNDVEDSYQGPTPDDRGYIHLTGGVAQRRRGYAHRSNHTSTGYLEDYHYDRRLQYWDYGIRLESSGSVHLIPTSLNFGEVVIGDTGFAEIRVESFTGFVEVDSFSLSYPFFVDTIESVQHGQNFVIGFVPPGIGNFTSQIRFFFDGFWLGAPLNGQGVPPPAFAGDLNLPQSFSLSAYPNPFNPETHISLNLPAPVLVRLDVFDISGRRVADLLNESMSAGNHDILFNGAALSAGVYFARVEAGTQIKMTKLLLLK